MLTPLVIHYPVGLIVELWIGTCTFDSFLKLRVGASEISFTDNTAIAQHCPPNRQSGFGSRLVFWIWVVYLTLEAEPYSSRAPIGASLTRILDTSILTMSPETPRLPFKQLIDSFKAATSERSLPPSLLPGFRPSEPASLRFFRVVCLHLSPDPQTQTPIQSATCIVQARTWTRPRLGSAI